MTVGDEVEVAVILNELVSLLLYAIDEQVAVDDTVLNLRSLRSLGNDQLTLGIEVVGACGKGSTVGKGLTLNVLGAQSLIGVDKDLVSIADEIEVAVVLNQLVTDLLDIVDVQVSIDDTVLGLRSLRNLGDDHLTIGTKVVIACGNGGAVSEGLTLNVLGSQILIAVDEELVAVRDEVEVTLVLNKHICLQHITVLVEVAVVRTGVQNSCAGGVALVVNRVLTVEELGDGVHLHITGMVEQVGLAINLVGAAGGRSGRSVAVVAGAVPVTDTRVGSHPGTLGHAAIVEDELDALIGNLFTVKTGKGLGVEVVPIVVNANPTAGQLTDGGKVSLTVDDVETGACIHVTASADQLSAGNVSSVGMTGSGNRGTPVNDGVTALAEGAAGIAGLRAGGSLVVDSDGGMDVGGAVGKEVILVNGLVGGIHLGIHVELLVGEGGGLAVGVGDQTLINVHLHILREEVVLGPVGFGGEAGNLDVGIEVDDTDGELSQNGGTGLGVITGAGDGDGSGVGLGVDGVLSGEAVGQIHVVQLPMVDAVEVDRSLNRLNGLNGVCLQIHPVDGAEGDAIQGRIGGNELQGRSVRAGLDLHDADDNRLVAHLIADLELDAVVAVGNLVTVGNHLATVEGAVYLNAVDVNLGGGGIQTGNVVQGLLNTHSVSQGGLVGHGGRQVQDVGGGGDDVALDQRSGAIQIDLIEDGILSVVNGVGVIHGEAVHVVGVGTVDGTVGLPQEVVLGSVGDDGDEELTLLGGLTGGLTVSVLLVELVGILQSHLLEGGDVHGHIMPAGLVDVVVDVLGLHHADGSQSVVGAVAVGIGHVVTLHPALDVILGNIEPETDAAGVLQLDGLAVHAQTDPGVVTGVGLLGGKTVDLQTHGVIAVVDLTVVAVCQRELQVVVTVVVGTAVDDVPLVNVDLAVLKVPQDLGALAQIELNGGGGVAAHVQGSGQGAGKVCGSKCLGHSDEVQAVEGTQSLIGGGEGHVARAQTDLLSNAVHKGGCLHGDLSGLAEGNGNYGLLEVQGVGGHDGHGLLAHDLTVVDHLSGDLTLGAVRLEYTVLDGAHAGFLDGPLNVSGNIHLGTDSVSTQSVEGNGSAGGVVVVVSGQVRAGKLTVRGSGGNHQDGIGGRTLTAVGQGAVHLQVLTGTLRAEGGGSAAVAVCGNDTTHLDHVLSHLVGGETGRVRSLLTVGNGDHQRTVGADAHEGSGGDTRAVIGFVLVHGVTIGIGLDQEAEQHGDSLLLPAGQGIGGAADPGLGHIGGTGLTGDGVVIVVDDHDGGNTAGLEGTVGDTAVAVVLTVQDGVTERLTDEVRVLGVVGLGVPAQGAVGRHDNVTVAQLLGLKGLSGGGLGTVVAFLRPHTLGTGDNLDEGVVDIHDSGVENLSSGTALIVQDLLELLNTGSDIPLLLGNDLVIVTSTVGVVIITGKRVQRNHADQHDHREGHGQNLRHLTNLHSVSPFC